MNDRAYRRAIEFIDSLDKRHGINREAGWVYIVRNPELKQPLLKVGMTKRPPHERANELGSSTSVPGSYELIYFVHTSDARKAEKVAHDLLASARYQSNKEFFATDLNQAANALDKAATAFPLRESQRNRGLQSPKSKVLPQACRTQIRPCHSCGKRNRVRSTFAPMTPRCGGCGKNLA